MINLALQIKRLTIAYGFVKLLLTPSKNFVTKKF